MIKCKQAIKFGSSCGKLCCCLECEDKDVCGEVCTDLKANCVEAFAEENSLVAMQSEVGEVIQAIADLTLQKKAIEEQEKEMRVQLMTAMERYGVKNFENDRVKFTYIAPTTRTTIDSAKLKKELPKIAEKYSKISDVSASVKITVK